MKTFAERLSGADLSFLALEDGRAHMHVGLVSVFESGGLRLDDGSLDFERIVRFVESELHTVPRLRQKLAWVKGFHQPVWVDDADFNLRFHLRHTALPPPSDIRQLKRLAGRIMSQELDRGKPLWEHWFVDRVDGDRFALISKVHHCLADGMAGLAIIGTLVRPDPAPDFEPLDAEEWTARPAPGDLELVADEVRHRMMGPTRFLLDQARGSSGGGEGSMPSPAELRTLMRSTFGAGTPTPLNVPVGPHRRFDWVALPFEDVHDIAGVAGAKVNDVVLAITAGALRAFLGSRNEQVDGMELRAMVPVNVRSRAAGSDLGNQVSNLIVPLPIGEADPWTRLELISTVTQKMKKSNPTVGFDAFGQLVDLLPSPLLAPVLRRGSQSTPANLAVSNLVGPASPVYLLGARQLAMYPVLPLIGNQALGICLMSYDGNLCWGFNADWDAVPDLHDLVEDTEEAFDELLAASAEIAGG